MRVQSRTGGQGRWWRTCLALLMLPGSGVLAALPLDFDQARERLESVSNALAAADAEVRGARELEIASRHLRVPEVSVEARYLKFQKTLELPLGSLAPVAGHFGIPDPLEFRLGDWRLRPIATAVVPLYTGGKIPAAQDAATAAVAEAEAGLVDAAQSQLSQLVQAYFGQVLAARVLAVRREVSAGTARHLAHATRLEEEGFATRAQRLQATVARDAAAREYAKAQNDHDATRASLALLLRSEQPVEPASPLFVITREPPPQSVFLADAREHHPQLAKLRALAAKAEAGVRVSRAELKPQVYLFGQYDLYRRDALITDTDWAFGIGLKYTLLSGSDRRRQVGAALAREDQALAGLAEAENRIAIGIAQAWSALDSARRQFLALHSSIESARESLRLQDLSFREGQATSLDVNDARLALGAALAERAVAAYEYDVALAKLLELSGRAERFGEWLNDPDVEVLQ